MASFVSSTFTTGERRKKVITYGKLSRLPPPRPSLIEEDAPSPERLHKHTASANEPSAGPGGLTKSARSSVDARAATSSPDVFDVPSEDEFGFPSTPPAKRPVVQRSKTDAEPRANTVKKAANVPNRPAAPVPAPQQKSKPAGVKAKSLQEQTRPQRPAQAKDTQTGIQLASATLQTKAPQTKAPQTVGGQKQPSGSKQPLRRSNASSKDVSRATSPGAAPQPMPKPPPTKTASKSVLKKTGISTNKLPASLDLFDVPSDDEVVSLPIPAAPRQTPRPLSKVIAKQPESRMAPSLHMTRKPTELGNQQNRKRKGSVSLANVPTSAAELTQKAAEVQRDRKIPKRQIGSSPGHESVRFPAPGPAPQAAASGTAMNKPRRTRTRTVLVANQPAMMKGQSSPAVLHKMLPVGRDTILAHDNNPDVPASDDTMYDIPDPMITPVRPTSLQRTAILTPGSVTPRQKDLFSALLGGTAAPKTPASALAALQLTDKKPRSLLGALARSKSDVSYSSQSRKTRLIDTLKDDDTSSEDEDSESDEEAKGIDVTTHDIDNDKTPVQTKRIFVEEASDDVTVKERPAGDSQTSQISSGATTRPKLTYATQRSYLQEANPEDEFLMSMDMDDGLKMDSQTVSTDDEDGPTSQPRTHHELRKHGQNTMFSWDMEESIREISDGSNKSGQRSAMMDLCTKMADAGFVSQLLDSGFMHKLLLNIVVPDDLIFDIIAAVIVLFVLQTKPAFAVVDQIYRSGVMATLLSLIDKDADITRVARDRKSSMSKIAQESMADFRARVLAAKAWSPSRPETVSPQLIALKTIDLLVQSLRESGSTDALLDPTDLFKVVNICSLPSSRVKATKSSLQDRLVLDLAISVLETVSIVGQDHFTWPTKTLHQLSEVISVFFESQDLRRTVEAMKLCMNLTNNKPKACQPFAVQSFVQPLVRFIVGHFSLLDTGDLDPERRSEVLAALTLSLGAMINLAELNDQARINAVDDTDSIEVLVKKFAVGSRRAAEASSVEESELGVVVGFLAVLLGMLCLNVSVRSRIQALLPEQRLHLLLQNMREFARIHEHVDKKTASRFEGAEGQEALNNYYVRIMHVVKKLEGAKA